MQFKFIIILIKKKKIKEKIIKFVGSYVIMYF